MLRLTFCLVLIMCGSLSAQIGFNRPPVPNQRATEASKELAKSIRDAKSLLAGVQNRSVRKKLDKLLSQAEGNLAVVQAELLVAHPNMTDTMNRKAFLLLMKDVKDQSFSAKKSKYLVERFSRLGNTERLSSRQLMQLTKEIEFDKDRVTAVVGLYTYVADKQNLPDVLKVLSFESSRKQVRKELGIKK